MTMKDAARTALEVQDAVNLSGVVSSFFQVTQVLWTEARKINAGTDYVNQHPICTLFIDKLASLNGSQTDGFSKVMDAYDDVRSIAEGV